MTAALNEQIARALDEGSPYEATPFTRARAKYAKAGHPRSYGVSAAEYNATHPGAALEDINARTAARRRELDPLTAPQRFDFCPQVPAGYAPATLEASVDDAELCAHAHAKQLLAALQLSPEQTEVDARRWNWAQRSLDSWTSCAATAQLLGLVEFVGGSSFHVRLTREGWLAVGGAKAAMRAKLQAITSQHRAAKREAARIDRGFRIPRLKEDA